MFGNDTTDIHHLKLTQTWFRHAAKQCKRSSRTSLRENRLKPQRKEAIFTKEEPTQNPSRANSSRKRKSTNGENTEDAPPPKRTKTPSALSAKPKDEPTTGSNHSKPIIINRTPVLQLWAASVAHLTYPQLSWETCLSAGSAVASMCAVAKGRSIGTVPEKNDSEAKQNKREKAKKKEDLYQIKVMHFNLKLKNGLAVVGSDTKGKPASKDALEKEFGMEQYDRTKDAFNDALRSWKGEEDELNKKAFHFYEKFRPDVGKNTTGWGRKGDLVLESVMRSVQRVTAQG